MKTRANAKVPGPELLSKLDAYLRGNYPSRVHGVARCGELVVAFPAQQ